MNRILIAGLGSIGVRHLGIMRERFPNATIYILRRNKGAETPPMADGCFHSIQNAVEFSPDISVICSPATLHVSQALALADAGSHIFIEKPLSDSSHNLEALEQVAMNSDVKIMLGYNLRFTRSLQTFKQLVDKGVHGKTLSIRAEVGQHLANWRPGSDYRQSVSARKDTGGGVLLELSHEIDYLQWIFGPYDWVCGHSGKVSNLELNVEDNATLMLGKGSADETGQPSTLLSMDFFRQDTTRKCTVIGDKGTLVWDGIVGSVSLFTLEAGSWKYLLQEENDIKSSYDREWDAFLESIKVDKQPGVSLSEGRQVLQIIEAVRNGHCQLMSLETKN